ncbi:MAG: hypothetical protein WD267_01865 [Balneolales bacterium]
MHPGGGWCFGFRGRVEMDGLTPSGGPYGEDDDGDGQAQFFEGTVDGSHFGIGQGFVQMDDQAPGLRLAFGELAYRILQTGGHFHEAIGLIASHALLMSVDGVVDGTADIGGFAMGRPGGTDADD